MPRDRLIVAEQGSELVGYCLVLMNAATRLARIYSIAVSPSVRGRGVGERLVREAEKEAVEADRIVMRLEVREDNAGAINLYRRLGYRQFGTYRDYYEDHGTALRFERRILYYKPSREYLPVPYYPQTTEFTCGPSALIMAMAALDEQQTLNTLEELKIWREATTIFMLAGHGGAAPTAWHCLPGIAVLKPAPGSARKVRCLKTRYEMTTRSEFWNWCMRVFCTTSARPASSYITTRSHWKPWKPHCTKARSRSS